MNNSVIKIGPSRLDLSRPAVMTILNVTPDSFHAASRHLTDQEIEAAVDEAVSAGADIIDVGGYSSRPGADDVSPQEELRRVTRGVRIIREKYPLMPVSLDTFRASVVREIYERFGPVMINDISAGQLDGDMVRAAALMGLPYVAMHMRADPKTMQQHTLYDDIIDDVVGYFREKVAELQKAGVSDIILDPGFGFAKTTEQNYRLLSGMERLCELGYPVLAGISRKSMIYRVLGVEPQDALAGTTALHWECLDKGASILRVHDTREAADAVKIYEFYKLNHV